MALTDKLTAIADAVRSKTGKADMLTLDQMPTEITGIRGALPVCEVKVIELPHGSCYLNHKQLPEIPAEALAEYPYAVVLASNSDSFILWLSTEKMYITTVDGETARLRIYGYRVRYSYYVNANAWLVQNAASAGNYGYYDIHGDGNWAVWWANHDICIGSADSGEIYFPASLPQEEQPTEATHYYHNGVRLPAIPTDVLAEYPYAFIHMSATRYNLVFSKTKYYYQSSDNTAQSGDWVARNYWLTFENMATGQNWSHRNDSGYYWENFSDSILWSNYDIPNGSADAEEIYYYGTVAVPDPLQGGI